MLAEWAVNLDMWKQHSGETRTRKDETANCTKGNNQSWNLFVFSKEGWVTKRQKKPVGRKARTDWMRSNLNDGVVMYSLRMNQSVMLRKLLGGRNIQLKNWRKQIRKERNYHLKRLYNFKEACLIARKNEADIKLRSLNEWRDLMEWCGKFNWKSGCRYRLRSGENIKWKVGIMHEW